MCACECEAGVVQVSALELGRAIKYEPQSLPYFTPSLFLPLSEDYAR